MDKYARKTYIENYGEPSYYPTDVYKRKIPQDPLDLYMTSPPCQAFSQAGSRLGKEDKRGILFFNSHEFIQKNKPRFFIFENVKGLLSHDNGKTFQEWINFLGGKSINGLPVLFADENAVPYHIYYKVINAKKLNVPQNRERVFIVGIKHDKDNVFQFPKEEHLTKKLKDVLENEVDEKYFLSNKMINWLLKHTEKHKEKGTGFQWQPKDENDIANCLRANGALAATDNTLWIGDYRVDEGLRIRKDGNSPCIHTRDSPIVNNLGKIRRLTPRECFRLMDFPENFNWSCSDSQAYKQAGNSIVVKCLEKIIEKLKL
jgi:DNA (cytosine-5)-methyltransferase 1